MHLKQSNLSKNVVKTTSGVLAALSILSNSAFAVSPDDSKKSSSISPKLIVGITTGGLLVASGFAIWCLAKSEKATKSLMDYRDSLDTINGTKNKTGLYYEVCVVEEFLENKIHKNNDKEFKQRFKKIKETINKIDDEDEKLFSSFKPILVEDLKSIVTNILEGTNVSETGKVTDFVGKIEKVEKKVSVKEVENKSIGNKISETKVNETKANETKANETKANETKANETKANETKANETKVNETKVNETKVNKTKVNETKVDEKSLEKESIINEKYRQELRNFNIFTEEHLKSKRFKGITDEGSKIEILKMVVGNLLAVICKYDNSETLLVERLQKTYELETFEKIHEWIISIDDGVKYFEEFYNGCSEAMKAEVSLSVGMLRKFADYFGEKSSKTPELAKKK